MIRLPKFIEIGPYLYRVRSTKAALAEKSRQEGELLDGFICTDTQTIGVNIDCDPGSARYTVMHEIVHGLLEVTGIDREWAAGRATVEEEFVTRFTPALLDLVRRNPALIEYVTAK